MQKMSNLLHKEMTRKEFLATIGFGLASIVGLGTLLQLLGKESPWQQNNALGYGDGPYGGRRA